MLAAIRRGASPADAAARVGVPVQALYARARFDAQWLVDMDAALMAGRDPGVPHGAETGYRHYRCRCPECRAAHHPKPVGLGS